MAYGQIKALYDENMNLIPSSQTTNFIRGSWSGYVTLQTSSGKTLDLGLHALDSVSGVGGNSSAVTWTVP